MTDVLLTVAGVLGVGVLFVLLPQGLDTWQKYRYRKVVTCPETNQLAEIAIDARQATVSSLFGRVKAQVTECSGWPKRQGCAQKCVSAE